MSSSLVLYLVFSDMVSHWTQSLPNLLDWPSSKLWFSICLHHPTHPNPAPCWLQRCVNTLSFYMSSWEPESGVPAYTPRLHGLSHLPIPWNCFKLTIAKWKILPFSYNVVQLPHSCNSRKVPLNHSSKKQYPLSSFLIPFPVFPNLQGALSLHGFIYPK